MADTEDVGEFTAHLRAAVAEQTAAYERYKDLERRYQAALAEIETLRADLQRLQRGEGIVVEIDGKKFTLNSGKADVSGMVTMTDTWVNSALQPNGALSSQNWMNDQPQKHDTQRLEKSLADSYLS